MKEILHRAMQIPFAMYDAVLKYVRVIGMGVEDLFFSFWPRKCQREMLCCLCAKDKNEYPLMTQRVLGLRKPGSSPGTWYNAWVAININGKITVCRFHDRLDYTSTKYTWHEVLKEKHSLENHGWERMSRDDIRKTAGNIE